MKLNFWQWLGLIVFLIALGALIWRETGGHAGTTPNPTAPSVPAPTWL